MARRRLQTHRADDVASPPPPAPPLSEPTVDPPDFHRALSYLRQHPAVLRALGLVLELRLPMSSLPTDFSEGFV